MNYLNSPSNNPELHRCLTPTTTNWLLIAATTTVEKFDGMKYVHFDPGNTFQIAATRFMSDGGLNN